MENHVGTINVLQCAGHVAADAEAESVADRQKIVVDFLEGKSMLSILTRHKN